MNEFNPIDKARRDNARGNAGGNSTSFGFWTSTQNEGLSESLVDGPDPSDSGLVADSDDALAWEMAEIGAYTAATPARLTPGTRILVDGVQHTISRVHVVGGGRVEVETVAGLRAGTDEVLIAPPARDPDDCPLCGARGRECPGHGEWSDAFEVSRWSVDPGTRVWANGAGHTVVDSSHTSMSSALVLDDGTIHVVGEEPILALQDGVSAGGGCQPGIPTTPAPHTLLA